MRSPSRLVLDIRDLPQRVGAFAHHDITYTVTEPWGTPVIAVPPGTELALSVDLTSIEQGVLARIRTHAVAVGECVRCLDPVEREVDVDTSEVFYLSIEVALLEGDDEEDATDFALIEGDSVDLTGPLLDAIVSQLPYQPLCSPDCPGLCPTCGVPLRSAEPGHHHEVADPRWQALEGFFGKDDE